MILKIVTLFNTQTHEWYLEYSPGTNSNTAEHLMINIIMFVITNKQNLIKLIVKVLCVILCINSQCKKVNKEDY